ncbi:right-handed parallel beta-helix repeat-containing protein [Agrobacterium cavarae]|uniref:right-handed parallel beta-helix repeat-containing protein n=1 Tax=Agrobacterium cavarae TaxID=2528239 RepID=UPI00289DB60F|nr:right-handed parallel beta-helix repeat-containing protein [Agrobacterium cavarae]
MMYSLPRLSRRFFLGLPAFAWTAGASAGISTKFYTPEQFGADPIGEKSSSIAFANMFNKALGDGIPCICNIENAVYRFDQPLIIKTRGKPVCFKGMGLSSTKIIIDGWFTGISIGGAEGFEARVELRDFEITRSNYKLYDGSVGKRSIEITWADGVTISGVKESGSIGFGIFLDRCKNYEISHCVVTDHFTGKTHSSGTDGIHIYRSEGPGRVFGNVVHDVGDDAISFGSFTADSPTLDFECYGNVIQDVAGSVKVYGNAKRFRIYDNQVIRPKTGGVVIYDDRGPDQSFVISNGEIFNNIVRGQIGAGICGGIAVWSPTGDGMGSQRNIVIRNNQIEDGNFGITVASQTPHKAPMDITIKDNAIAGMRQRGIMIDGIGGSFLIAGNEISDTGFEGAFLGAVQTGMSIGMLDFTDNKLSNSGLLDSKRLPIKAADDAWMITNNLINGVVR